MLLRKNKEKERFSFTRNQKLGSNISMCNTFLPKYSGHLINSTYVETVVVIPMFF